MTGKDLRSVRCFEDNGASFVLLTCLRQPGFMEVAVIVAYILDRSVGGNPVGMHVEKAHEDAYHDAPVVEIFVFLRLFHHDDLAVGRRQNESFRLAFKGTDWTLEEVEQDSVEDAADCYADVEGETGLEIVQYGEIEHQQDDGAP